MITKANALGILGIPLPDETMLWRQWAEPTRGWDELERSGPVRELAQHEHRQCAGL